MAGLTPIRATINIPIKTASIIENLCCCAPIPCYGGMPRGYDNTQKTTLQLDPKQDESHANNAMNQSEALDQPSLSAGNDLFRLGYVRIAFYKWMTQRFRTTTNQLSFEDCVLSQ